jgi:dienelactone hydrolase
MKSWAILLGMLAAFAAQSQAAIKTETVAYKHGDVVLEGYLAYDDAQSGKRPGVLVVHEWKGLGNHAKHSAEELAKLGYVALAVDMYGKGIRPQTNQEAATEAGKYKNDRALMRARINAGLAQLKSYPTVDPQRIGAIGYCFGGLTVLELARSGADVKGVVSFHGGLDSPTPADGKNIKAKVLVLHGADDPYVPAADIAAFQEELRKGGIDWRMIYYGGAVHSFTNPEAGTDNSKGAAYNEQAAKRSWEAMKTFFAEIFP